MIFKLKYESFFNSAHPLVFTRVREALEELFDAIKRPDLTELLKTV